MSLSFLQKFAQNKQVVNALAISSRLLGDTWLVIHQCNLFAMARIVFLFAAAVLINFAAAFVPSSVQGAAVGVGSSDAVFSSSALGMAETDAYDIVKVDLDDGRDYPIYIGAEFDEAEGEQGLSLWGCVPAWRATACPSEIGEMQIRPCESHLPGVPLLFGQLTSSFAFIQILSIDLSNIQKQLERSFDHMSREIVLLSLPMIGLPRFTSTNTRQ